MMDKQEHDKVSKIDSKLKIFLIFLKNYIFLVLSMVLAATIIFYGNFLFENRDRVNVIKIYTLVDQNDKVVDEHEQLITDIKNIKKIRGTEEPLINIIVTDIKYKLNIQSEISYAFEVDEESKLPSVTFTGIEINEENIRKIEEVLNNYKQFILTKNYEQKEFFETINTLNNGIILISISMIILILISNFIFRKAIFNILTYVGIWNKLSLNMLQLKIHLLLLPLVIGFIIFVNYTGIILGYLMIPVIFIYSLSAGNYIRKNV